MNSSKGWGDDLEMVSHHGDIEFRRRAVRGAAVVLIAIALVASIWAGWTALQRQCEPLLEQSRELLRYATDDPAQHIEDMRKAESLLRDYLDRNGPNQDIANLLLCASMTLRGAYDPNQKISEKTEIEELLNQIRLSACTVDDLLTAINLFMYSGKLAQADWLVTAAIKMSEGTPEHQGILRLAANIRYDLGQEKEVFELCEQLSAIDPTDPQPWRLTAMVNEDAGYAEALIEALKKVLELDSGDTSEDRLLLLNNLITIGNRTQARHHFAVLEEQAPDLLSRNPLTRARLLMLEGEVSEANKIIQQALAKDPESTEAIMLRSQQLLSENKLDEAAQILERLLEIDPMSFQTHYRLGQVYARLGERERAEQHLAMHQRILDLRVRIHSLERRAGRNPHDTEAREELIRAYEVLGMTDQANFWRRASASSSR